MGRIEEEELKNKRKGKKTEIYVVDLEDVIKALREERDNLFKDIEREREGMQGEKSLYIQAGFIDAIKSIKKVKGEWK